jgi:hypothetical protein
MITSWYELNGILDVYVCFAGSENHNVVHWLPNGTALWDPHLPHRFVVLPACSPRDLWLMPTDDQP